MNIAFYVSGRAGRLKRILEWDMDILNDTVLVFTDSENAIYIREPLEKQGITFEFFNYEEARLMTTKPNLLLSDKMLELFITHSIDICYCFGDHILRGELLNSYSNRIINFHPSVLPMFPGRQSIDQALESSAILIGNTAHYIDEGIDTGTIISQIVFRKKDFAILQYDGLLDYQLLMLWRIHSKLTGRKISHEVFAARLIDVEYLYVESDGKR